MTLLVAAPLAGALLLGLPALERRWSRLVAGGAAGLALLVAVYLCLAYDQRTGGVQFLARGRWLPALGASYLVGVDGLSLPLVLLTAALLVAVALLPGQSVETGRGFWPLVLLQAGGVLGALVSLDLLLFLVFAGLAILPAPLLSTGRAARRGTLHLLGGAAVVSFGVLLLYFQTGMYTFDLLALTRLGFAAVVQERLFPVLALGFALWLPAVPFHRWLPEVFAAAPGAAGLLQVGVLVKLGAYGMLRMALALFPEGARNWAPALAAWGAAQLLYGAFLTLNASEPPRVLASWSLSQAGLLLLGIAALTKASLTGAALQMASHGLALGFAAVAMAGRPGDGLSHASAAKRWVAVLAAWGLPGFAPFVAQGLILSGAYRRFPVATGLGVAALFLAGWRLVALAREGGAGSGAPGLRSSGAAFGEFLAFGTVLLIFGLWPGPVLRLVAAGLGPLLARTGGAP